MGKWTNSVFEALKNCGGQAAYEELYQEFENLCKKKGYDLSIFNDYKGKPNWKSTVRRELQQHSSHKKAFLNKGDLFFPLKDGIWAIKDNKTMLKIICFYLSKYLDFNGVKNYSYNYLGFKNRTDASKKLASIFNDKQSNVKNFEDMFDSVNDNHRKGWYQKPISKSFKDVVRIYSKLNKGELEVLCKKLINKDEILIKKVMSVKNKQIQERAWKSEINLTKFLDKMGFEIVEGPRKKGDKRGINFQGGQIDVVGKYKNILVLGHCSTNSKYINLKNKFEQIPTKQANTIAYLKNPKLDAHKKFQIKSDTKVICVFDCYGVPIEDVKKISKKIDSDPIFYKDFHLWDTQFKNYYLDESKLDQSHARSWLLYSLGFDEPEEFLEFDATVIDYGIDGVDNSYIISTTQKKFSDYSIVSHRIPYFQGEEYYQRLLKQTRLKNIAEKYLDSQKGYFPNNIIANIEDSSKFEFTPDKNSNGKYGKIKILKKHCARIIDGQHRFYSYLKSKNRDRNLIINILNLKESQEAEFFVKINEEQVGIDKELLTDLKGVMYPNLIEGKLSRTIKNMNSDKKSYFYEKIKMPSFDSEGTQLPISTLFREINKRFKKYLENKNTPKGKANFFYFNPQDPENQEIGPQRLSSIISDFFNILNDNFSEKFKDEFFYNSDTPNNKRKAYTHIICIDLCFESIKYLNVNSKKFGNDNKTKTFFKDLVDSIESSEWEGLSGEGQYEAYTLELVQTMRLIKGHKNFAPDKKIAAVDIVWIQDNINSLEPKLNAILLKLFIDKYGVDYFLNDEIIQKYIKNMKIISRSRIKSKQLNIHPQKFVDFSFSLNSFMLKSAFNLAERYDKQILKMHDGNFLSLKLFEQKLRAIWEFRSESTHKTLTDLQFAKKYNSLTQKEFRRDVPFYHKIFDYIMEDLDIDFDDIDKHFKPDGWKIPLN